MGTQQSKRATRVEEFSPPNVAYVSGGWVRGEASESSHRTLEPPPHAAVEAALLRGDMAEIPGSNGMSIRVCVCKYKQIEVFVNRRWVTSLFNLHLIERTGTVVCSKKNTHTSPFLLLFYSFVFHTRFHAQEIIVVEENRVVAEFDKRELHRAQPLLFLLCTKAEVSHHSVLDDDTDMRRCDFCDVPCTRQAMLQPCYATSKYHVPEDFCAAEEDEPELDWRRATVLPPGASQREDEIRTDGGDVTPRGTVGSVTPRAVGGGSAVGGSISGGFGSSGAGAAGGAPAAAAGPGSVPAVCLSVHSTPITPLLHGATGSVFGSAPPLALNGGTPTAPSINLSGCSRASLSNASYYTGSTPDSRETYMWDCPACLYTNASRTVQATCVSCGSPQRKRARASFLLLNDTSHPLTLPRSLRTPVGGAVLSAWEAVVGAKDEEEVLSPRSEFEQAQEQQLSGTMTTSECATADTALLSSSKTPRDATKTCLECSTGTACMVFMPCRHVVTCPQCAPEVYTCPKCAEEVTHRLEVYV